MTDLAKHELRREIRSNRRAQPFAPGRGENIAATFLATAAIIERMTAEPDAPLALYVSLPGEPPTAELRARLRDLGSRVLLPVARPEAALAWIDDPGETATAWGTPRADPTIDAPPTVAETVSEFAALAPSIILVPALAATQDGRRLGQGGGYYDRFLGALPGASAGGPLRVALVGPGELLEEIPTDELDRPVDMIVTG